MLGINMVTHLWDLVDEGMETVLDSLQGRLHVTGLCVPLTCGPASHLRYGADVSPRVFRTRGGVLFQPDKDRYDNTRCKPLPAEWLKSSNPFGKLVDECRTRELALRAVIDCTNTGRIAAHDPHFARKNVFGDVSAAQLCPINPDVAEFLRALVANLAHGFHLDTVELTGLDAMNHHPNDPPHRLGTGGGQLLALCFCESCRQSAASAGVDVDSAARSALVRLDGVFDTGQPIEPSLATLTADDPPLAAFTAWYRERITELMLAMGESGGCHIAPHTPPLRDAEHAATDPGYTRGADTVVCVHAGGGTESLEPLLTHMLAKLADQQHLELQLHVHTPPPASEQTLFRDLTCAAEMGVCSANLDHYGSLPRNHADRVRQAVRYALRHPN